MGGQIKVSSEVGRGTTFKFYIKVNVVTPEEIKIKQPNRQVISLEPNQPNYRILIVDDHDYNRQLLVKMLKPFGFELKEAKNGKEALLIWSSWEPHLIWMDMRMPVMDGIEATQRIKATPQGKSIIIIALTASSLGLEDSAMGIDLEEIRKECYKRMLFVSPSNKPNCLRLCTNI